ncbi:MAG: preprotein translocase subunit SecG [Fusobacteriaceae bacterium]|jgi:preprotein translocase subunit SecG|nr:preprotein translocase subunit SecG [Fusobacteriaceae bacterium]
MNLSTLFTVILFISAILLIVLVLIQPDRSNGMSASMGLGGSNTVFGLSKDGGPLAKITKIVATIFIISALLLYLVKA